MAKSRLSRANRTLSWLLLLFVTLTPLSLGGNRPWFWLLNLGGLLLIWATYVYMTARSSGSHSRPTPELRGLAWLALAYPPLILAMALLQSTLGHHVAWVTLCFGLARVGSYVLFGYLCFQAYRNPKRAEFAAKGAVVVLAGYAAYGLLAINNPELLLYDRDAIPGFGYDGVATGPFINRNSFATYLAMAGALSLALSLSPRGQARRKARTQSNPLNLDTLIGGLLSFAPVPLFLTAALLTGSRMGLFVTFLGLITVFLLSGRGAKLGYGGLAALLTAGAIGLIAAFTYLFGETTFDRLGSTGQSADVRWELYQSILDMIRAAPLLGHGFDSFPQAYRLFHAAPVSADLRWDQAHNTYLELWSELGLILGSVPLLITAIAGLRLLPKAIELENRTRGLASAGLASIAIGGVHSLVDFSLEMPANVYLLIFIVMLALSPVVSKGGKTS